MSTAISEKMGRTFGGIIDQLREAEAGGDDKIGGDLWTWGLPRLSDRAQFAGRDYLTPEVMVEEIAQ
jgi:hypothetical protein